MKKIRAIGFDWGGVIEVLPIGSFADAAAAFLGIDGETYRKAYFLHNHLVNVGQHSKTYGNATELWTSVLSELGKLDQLEDFMAFVRSIPKGRIDERMIALIKEIKSHGFKIGLLSNQSAEGIQRIRETGYDQLFDVALFSAEIGDMKPHPPVFHRLIDELGVASEELIFIDDTERSLSTAQDVGFQPILYTNFDKLIHQLEELCQKKFSIS